MGGKRMENLFKPAVNKTKPTPKGAAGYDNARENIDPHIKTKVVNTKEITLSDGGGAGFVKNTAAGVLSGGHSVDISDDTNLAVTAPIILTDDTISIDDVETISTSLTAGSVVFSDGSNLAEDNANFFWDDTNKRLGIGTAAPAYPIDLDFDQSNQMKLGADKPFYLLADNPTLGLNAYFDFSGTPTWRYGKGSSNSHAAIIDINAISSGLLRFRSTKTAGNANAAAIMIERFTCNIDGVFKIGPEHPFYLIASNPTLGFNLYYDFTQLRWEYGAGSTNDYGGIIDVAAKTNGLMRFRSTPSAGNAEGAATVVTNMAITKDGDVGIGVTDPHSKLEVDGTISSSVKTITASSDAVDVAGVNTVFINPAAAVVIGGFANGVTGQRVDVVVVDADQNVTMEDEEATGTQKLRMHQSADETLASERGGWAFIFDGTYWYDVSHARHV